MSKRVFLTLPDSVFDDLELWAADQGRPVANLAAFLVEMKIREAKMMGEFPTPADKNKTTKKNE